MKKFLKLFMCVAVVAGFVGCSESSLIDLDGSTEENVTFDGPKTYVSFKLANAGTKTGTKAEAEFSPDSLNEDDQKDAGFGAGDLRILIFDSKTQAVEINDKLGKTDKNVFQVTAGKKKIFVFANTKNLLDLTTTLDSYKPGDKKLDDLNKLTFSAGTPQQMGIDISAEQRTFSLKPLFTYSDDKNNLGLPASNTNELEYTIKAGVSEEDAANGSAGDVNATSNVKNNFKIQLYYMAAKARLLVDPTVLNQGGNTIKDLTYSIKNLAKQTNYIQNVPGSDNIQSYYYSMYSDNTTSEEFYKEFDSADTSNVIVETSDKKDMKDVAKYLMVAENNNRNIRRGQSSFYAVRATFEPGSVISGYDYNIDPNKATPQTDSYENLGITSYIFTTAQIGGISTGSYFANEDVLKEGVWVSVNKQEWKNTPEQKKAAEKILKDAETLNGGEPVYATFENAVSWYRLDIGKGTGVNTEYGVLRGNKYTATIKEISGPGVPKPDDLITKPEEAVITSTHLKAVIEAAVWTEVNQSGVLN